MKVINSIALILIIVGGINWGLVGGLHFNLVETLFGIDTLITRVVYVLVGIAAVYSIALFKPISNCSPKHIQ